MALYTFPNPQPGQIRLHTLSAEGSGDLTDEDLQAEADVEIAQILVEKPATTGVQILLLSPPEATPSGAAARFDGKRRERDRGGMRFGKDGREGQRACD